MTLKPTFASITSKNDSKELFTYLSLIKTLQMNLSLFIIVFFSHITP